MPRVRLMCPMFQRLNGIQHRHLDPRKTKGLARANVLTLVILVRLAGFEPTTPWFVAKYSIQLSYSRQDQ